MSFPQPLLSTVNNQLHGRIFTLLDPVRDANFLNRPTTDALGNTIPDMGLGVVDNGMFFYTSKFQPSDPSQPRPYPVKFFWLGSPAGTNDATDNFSVFMADVDINAFYAGAPASVYLRNPRLVLSVLQAGKDIINWFDANYPYTTTPASGGVGQETPNGQSNTTYGILSSGGNPGNVSRMASLSAGASIDGQFWPVYDYVDNSVILYFSIKTPNGNTKSIYAYKTTDSEIASPLASSQFLGGAYATSGYFSSEAGGAANLSSHRFTITSPDPLITFPRVSGQQSAVVAYAFGTKDTLTPDHALIMLGFILSDIHGSPINWNTQAVILPNRGFGMDYPSLANVDKLGSIFPIGQQFQSSVYGILANLTSAKDIRGGSNNVVINSMQVRMLYLHFDSVTGGCMLMGDALTDIPSIEAIGHCRPQYTILPDGLPKIIFNNFNFDQSLKTVYQYIDAGKLRPENQRQLAYANDNAPNPFIIPTFGKKEALLTYYDFGYGISPNPQARPTVLEIQTFDGNLDASIGFYDTRMINKSLVMADTPPPNMLDGTGGSIINGSFVIKNLRTWLWVTLYGPNINNYPVVVLR